MEATERRGPREPWTSDGDSADGDMDGTYSPGNGAGLIGDSDILDRSGDYEREEEQDEDHDEEHWSDSEESDALQRVAWQKDARQVHVDNFLIYMLSILAVTFAVPAMAVIQQEMHLSSSLVHKIAASSTFGIAIGKFVNGWLVDSFGPRRAIHMAFSILVVALTMYATVQQGVGLIVVAFVIEFVHSSFHPSLMLVIRRWFLDNQPEVEFGVWSVSLASRVAGLCSIAIYSVLLYRLPSWRHVALLVVTFPILGLLFAYRRLHDSPYASIVPGPPLSRTAIWRAVRRIMCNRIFWLGVMTHACSTCVRKADLVLGPYLTNATTLTPREAGVVTIVTNVGYVVGLVALGPMFKRMGPRQKVTAVRFLYFVAILCLSLLVALTAGSCDAYLSEDAKEVWIGTVWFILPASISVPYYLIPHIYAIEAGGYNTGTLVAYFDGGAFLFATIFYVSAGRLIDGEGGWVAVWSLLLVIVCVGAFTMDAFVTAVLTRRGGPLIAEPNDDDDDYVEKNDDNEPLLDRREDSVVATRVM